MNANLVLIPHTASGCEAVRRIDVSVVRAAADSICFAYRIEGDISRLRLPETIGPYRQDGLWQHSCFEAFLRPDGSEAYFEFNFSPSGAWAAYRFSGRRTGRYVPELKQPQAEVRRGPDMLALNVRISLDELPELAKATTISAGLTAVIEDAKGNLSHWALAHGKARPDFHDPLTFKLRIRST
ncbi:MAG TPA: DOMON-like domain-containing protein [Steroidobacteraceae bacterium]|nr:DOMON-like domain-containing protein [Steroidobacteraceae bacterium]